MKSDEAPTEPRNAAVPDDDTDERSAPHLAVHDLHDLGTVPLAADDPLRQFGAVPADVVAVIHEETLQVRPRAIRAAPTVKVMGQRVSSTTNLGLVVEDPAEGRPRRKVQSAKRTKQNTLQSMAIWELRNMSPRAFDFLLVTAVAVGIAIGLFVGLAM